MRVVVCGGGMAGLTTALLLEGRDHDVTLLERDPSGVPADPRDAWRNWDRRGVAQLRQFHAFTALGRTTLRARLPDVYAALLDAGMTETNLVEEIRRGFPDASLPDDDGELVMLRGRRTTFEQTLREHVTRASRIDCRPGADVTGLVVDDHGAVGGVIAGGQLVEADLVVDATGRRTSAQAWRRDAGLPAPTASRHETGIVYYTRWYRQVGPPELLGSGIRVDLLSMRCVLAPADDGFMSLALMAAADDPALKALRDALVFHAVATQLPRIGRWVTAPRAEPESDVLFMGGLHNSYLAPVDATGDATPGLVVVGDAAVTTNPYFGRGCSLAFAHAAALTAAVEQSDSAADLAGRFALATDDLLLPWWRDSVQYDGLRRKWLRAARGEELTDDEARELESDEARALRALPIAMLRDPELLLLQARYIQSLDPPSRLRAPDVVGRVLELVTDDEVTEPVVPRAELLRLIERAS